MRQVADKREYIVLTEAEAGKRVVSVQVEFKAGGI